MYTEKPRKLIVTGGAFLLAALSLLVWVPVAQALPFINGSFGMNGIWRPHDGATGAPATTATATAIDFRPPILGGTGVFFVSAGSQTGDYLGMPNFTAGTIKDFTFSGTGSANFPTVPIATFWTLTSGGTTWSLDLTSVTLVSQNANSIVLQGFGTAMMTGRDNTAGQWDFSANQTGASFNWSATEASVVPEPATLTLLGLGLGALALRKRVWK